MGEIIYRVGDLRRVIAESSQNEFKPKLGINVERDDKKNAREAYENSKERAKRFDGGLREPKRNKLSPREDGNKTMLGLEFDADPGDANRRKWEAQTEGYTSELEKKNGIEKSGDFNDDFYKNEKETVEKMSGEKENIRTAGLVSSELKQKDKDYGKVRTAFKENRQTIKRLTYNHTTFMNESQIFTKIPEDFKVDGNKFMVRDASGSEYLIEWCEDKKANISEGRIINERNLKEADKKLDRIAELMVYNSSNIYGKGTSRSMVDEDKTVGDMLGNIRRITD